MPRSFSGVTQSSESDPSFPESGPSFEDVVMHQAAHILRESNAILESEHLQRCDVFRRHPYPREPSLGLAGTTQGRTDPSEAFDWRRLCRVASWAAQSCALGDPLGDLVCRR